MKHLLISFLILCSFALMGAKNMPQRSQFEIEYTELIFESERCFTGNSQEDQEEHAIVVPQMIDAQFRDAGIRRGTPEADTALREGIRIYQCILRACQFSYPRQDSIALCNFQSKHRNSLGHLDIDSLHNLMRSESHTDESKWSGIWQFLKENPVRTSLIGFAGMGIGYSIVNLFKIEAELRSLRAQLRQEQEEWQERTAPKKDQPTDSNKQQPSKKKRGGFHHHGGRSGATFFVMNPEAPALPVAGVQPAPTEVEEPLEESKIAWAKYNSDLKTQFSNLLKKLQSNKDIAKNLEGTLWCLSDPAQTDIEILKILRLLSENPRAREFQKEIKDMIQEIEIAKAAM